MHKHVIERKRPHHGVGGLHIIQRGLKRRRIALQRIDLLRNMPKPKRMLRKFFLQKERVLQRDALFPFRAAA